MTEGRSEGNEDLELTFGVGRRELHSDLARGVPGVEKPSAGEQ